jgi:hypothetical protein
VGNDQRAELQSQSTAQTHREPPVKSPGLKAWRARAKVMRTESAPDEGVRKKTWCETCRRMHEFDAHRSKVEATEDRPNGSLAIDD